MPKELNPKLKLWRQVLNDAGIPGILRKTDPRYEKIRAKYNKLVAKM